jgi:hypothetical protein
MSDTDNKMLLSIKDIMEMTGLGEKKIRQILKSPTSNFTIRNGNRLYAHRELFEDYMEKCAKFRLTL